MEILQVPSLLQIGYSKPWNSNIFTVRISLPTAIALTAVANPFNPYHGHEGLTQLNSSQSDQSLFEVVQGQPLGIDTK